MLKTKVFNVAVIATEYNASVTSHIPPGESRTAVSVPITPNIRVEDDENFDVIFHSNSSVKTNETELCYRQRVNYNVDESIVSYFEMHLVKSLKLLIIVLHR